MNLAEIKIQFDPFNDAHTTALRNLLMVLSNGAAVTSAKASNDAAPPKASNDAAPPKATADGPPAKATTFSLDDLRAALTEKVKAHKDVIIEKLRTFEVQNLTTLPEAHYDEFMEFLQSLK